MPAPLWCPACWLPLVFGRPGVSELSGQALTNPVVLKLSGSVKLIEHESYSERFPARRYARVENETRDGELFDSGEVEAKWEATRPPTDRALREKFRRLAGGQLPAERAADLEQIVWCCEELSDVDMLLALITMPVSSEYSFTWR